MLSSVPNLAQKIALVLDSWDFPFNGTVVSTRRFVQALNQDETDARLNFSVFSVPGEPSDGTVERVSFQRLPTPGLNGLLNAMRVPLARPSRRKLRAALQDTDLLHVQYPLFLGYAAIREARRLNIPVICSFHLQPENILLNLGLSGRWMTDLVYRLFCRYFYQRADLIIAPSEFAADLLRSHGVDRPIEVVSNGVLPEFLARKRSKRESDGKLNLLCVGRLAREKQQETLLRAVAASSHRSEIRLTLAGTGPREQHLLKTVRELNLDVQIGPVSDSELLDLYAGADLFVHAGAIELEGMSVLEAMATENCVIVSDSPDSASRTLVDHPMARFSLGNVEDLARKIDYWIDHPLDRIAQGQSNRQHAESYSHHTSVRKLRALYRSLLPDSLLPDQGSNTSADVAPDPMIDERKNGTTRF